MFCRRGQRGHREAPSSAFSLTSVAKPGPRRHPGARSKRSRAGDRALRGVQRSAFNVQRSTFRVQRCSFRSRYATFAGVASWPTLNAERATLNPPGPRRAAPGTDPCAARSDPTASERRPRGRPSSGGRPVHHEDSPRRSRRSRSRFSVTGRGMARSGTSGKTQRHEAAAGSFDIQQRINGSRATLCIALAAGELSRE